MIEANILQNIEVAFSESEELLMNAHLIKTTEQTRASIKPISFIDSDFGLWLVSKGRVFAKHQSFIVVSDLHQKLYEAYSKVYHGAQDSSNANRNNNLTDNYAQFEELIDMYHGSLKKIVDKTSKNKGKSNQAMHELNIILKENIDLLETENPVENKAHEIIKAKAKSKVEETFDTLEKEKKSNMISNEYLAVREKLEQETRKQFKLKKQLIEQEIKQVSERQKLFIKAVDQQTHHYQLIQQEAKFITSKYDNQISQNKDIQNKKKHDLEDTEKNRISTQNELEQLELANIAIEDNNAKELSHVQESLTELDQQQQVFKDDIKKKIKQQDRKKQRLDKLKEQIAQAEQELEIFVEDELQLLEKESDVTKAKSSVRNEIKELLVSQHTKRDQNSQLEDSKYQNLKQFKKLYYSLQQEILHLEHEQHNLTQGKQESEHSQQRELEELQKQRKIKQDMLDILDLELHQKDLELQSFTLQSKPSAPYLEKSISTPNPDSALIS